MRTKDKSLYVNHCYFFFNLLKTLSSIIPNSTIIWYQDTVFMPEFLIILIFLFQFEQDGYVVLEDFLRGPECDELVEAGLELTKQAAEIDPKPIFSTVDPEIAVFIFYYTIQSFNSTLSSRRYVILCSIQCLVQNSEFTVLHLYHNNCHLLSLVILKNVLVCVNINHDGITIFV